MMISEVKSYGAHCLKAGFIGLIGLLLTVVPAAAGGKGDDNHRRPFPKGKIRNVQVGPRPFYLIENMDDSTLSHRSIFHLRYSGQPCGKHRAV